MTIKQKFINFLRWLEKYTGTDMLYIAKGGGFAFLTSAGASAIAFVKMIAFGKLLDQQTYGIYTYIISMTALLGIFSLPSIDTAMIRSIAQKKEGTFILALKTRLKWSLTGSLLLLLIAAWYFFNKNNLLAILFLMAAVFFPAFSVFDSFNRFWQAKKRFDIYFKYEIIAGILVAVFLIGALLLTNNIILILLTFFLSYFIFYGIYLRKTIKSVENKKEDKEAISFGKTLTLIEAMNRIGSQIDKIIIWKFLGPVSVAIYSFALLPISKIQDLSPIATVALPKLGEKNIKEIKLEIIKKFYKLFLFSIPLAGLAAIVAPYFYKIFFPQYLGSIPYFQALSLILALLPFSLLESSLVSAMKKKELYIINLIIPLIKVALFLALIPFLSIWGIVAAIITAYLLNGSFVLYFFRKI